MDYYQAEITRARPGCFVFMIDQSWSMNEPVLGSTDRCKKDVVAEALNKLLHGIIRRCPSHNGVLGNYFKVAIIGYGSGGEPGSVLRGGLAGMEMVTTRELDDNRLRLETRKEQRQIMGGGFREVDVKYPVWVEPEASDDTPMRAAFQKVHRLLDTWVEENPSSFPPIVLNLTDGVFTDADPSGVAEQIKNLATSDGQALVFNLHIGGAPAEGDPSATGVLEAEFPSGPAGLDGYGTILFNMSSVLPRPMLRCAAELRFPLPQGSRGFVYNADITKVSRFLKIGTRAKIRE